MKEVPKNAPGGLKLEREKVRTEMDRKMTRGNNCEREKEWERGTKRKQTRRSENRQ